jgi:hypothetical protein
VMCGLSPEIIGDRVRPVAQSGDSLGERERRALSVGEVGCSNPGELLLMLNFPSHGPSLPKRFLVILS